MKGCVVMIKSCDEQLNAISQAFQKETAEFRKLPKEEARKKAQEDLRKIGLLDSQGNITEPYIALAEKYVQ